VKKATVASGTLGALGLLFSLPLFAAEGAVREDLRQWRYQLTVPTPADAGLAAVELTPAVFGKARPGLQDLRLTDGNGEPIPYALRVQRERQVRREVKARPFGRQTLPDGSEQLSLDLGASPPEHNELAVDVAATSYGRPLVLEGSADGEGWGTILDKAEVVRLSAGGQAIRTTNFPYPASRQRYLRVTLKPDRIDKSTATLCGVGVLFSVNEPGRWNQGEAAIEYRDPVRDSYSEPASAWVLNLGDANVPVSRLTLDVDQPQFERRFRLEAYEPGRPGQPLTSGTLSRQAGEAVVVEFPETAAHRLKLVVVDSRNEPLRLTRATYAAPSRLLVFRKPANAAEPLRLFVGNPSAEAPNYDFAATVPAVLDGLSAPTPGSRDENPAYVPPPPELLPVTERYPLLLDGVLVVALLVLGWLLFLLARTAIRRHDAAVAEGA